MRLCGVTGGGVPRQQFEGFRCFALGDQIERCFLRGVPRLVDPLDRGHLVGLRLCIHRARLGVGGQHGDDLIQLGVGGFGCLLRRFCALFRRFRFRRCVVHFALRGRLGPFRPARIDQAPQHLEQPPGRPAHKRRQHERREHQHRPIGQAVNPAIHPIRRPAFDDLAARFHIFRQLRGQYDRHAHVLPCAT